MINFPERLKILRQEKGLSQEQLGAHLNIPRTTISSWELGSRQADTSSINVLCNFFQVSADYLLGRIDVRNPIKESNLNSEMSLLYNRLPQIQNFIEKIVVRKQLQVICMYISDLSDDILLKLIRIARILCDDQL